MTNSSTPVFRESQSEQSNWGAQEGDDALRLHWAAERTLLAWVRTSLALFGLGFVVARFVMSADVPVGTSAFQIKHVGELTASVVGVAFIFVGALATANAAKRYREYVVGLVVRGSSASLAMSVLVSGLGVLLGIALIASL